MKLFYSPGACSLASHIVLREANYTFEMEAVDLRAGTCSSGDFKKINPKGYVPALHLDSGETLTEGTVIMQYISDQKPELNLVPKSGMARYRTLEWMNYIATEIHKGFSPLWSDATPADFKQNTLEQMQKRFTFVNDKLAGKEYLNDSFSIADAYLFTVLGWTRFLKIDLTPWPNLVSFLDRMQKRPAVAAALKAEGLV